MGMLSSFIKKNFAPMGIVRGANRAARSTSAMLDQQINAKKAEDELRNQLSTEAKDFRSNLPTLQRQRAGLLQDQAREALSTGLEDVRQGFQQRGLLYSGMRQGTETGLRSQVANKLRSSIAQTNKDLEEAALERERTVAAVGLQNFQQQLQRQSERDQMNMQNELLRARAFGELGQAAGYAAGSYFESRARSQPTYAQTNFVMPEFGSSYNSDKLSLRPGVGLLSGR